MEVYNSEKIRNVALIGHGGCGKTSLMELALLETGVINRVGTIEAGTTVSDYDRMEIETGHSINMSMIPIEYKDVKINFIDTPGLMDFSNEMYTAIQAAAVACYRCRFRHTGRNRKGMAVLQGIEKTCIYYDKEKRP